MPPGIPFKQNPVAPSVLVALARFAPPQAATMQGAGLHAEARDGAAWFPEWLALPPLVPAAAAAELGTDLHLVLPAEVGQSLEVGVGDAGELGLVLGPEAAGVVPERDLPVERVSCLSDLPRAVSLLERTKAALFDQYSFRNVSDLITKIDPLILHSHFANVAWQDLPAARRTGCSHVCSVYGYDIEQLPSHSTQWRKRYDLLAKRLHGVFCEGPHVKEVMVAQGFDPDRLFVNHLGVDLESLSFRPSTWDRKVPLRVLMAASFREKKGLHYEIDALDRFASDNPVELTIIGDAGPASEQKKEKRKIMASLEKATNISTVRLLGYQPHSRLVQETKSHHVFMQPSATASNGDTEGGAPVSQIGRASCRDRV